MTMKLTIHLPARRIQMYTLKSERVEFNVPPDTV